MNTPNDGGPIAASLVQTVPMGDGISQATHLESVGGLSIRAWLAGMALSSMDYGWFGSSSRIQEMASESVSIADAILIELGKESV